MKLKLFLIISIFVLYGCSKPQTVLICGDHICVNKSEAEQYFEDNLSIEVQIVDNKDQNSKDLVELNLVPMNDDSKKVKIYNKKNTNKKLRVLSKSEIKDKKDFVKKNKKSKNIKKVAKIKKVEKRISKEKNNKKKILAEQKTNKNKVIVQDICLILDKCNIDEISKYLIKQGTNRDFPDITSRE